MKTIASIFATVIFAALMLGIGASVLFWTVRILTTGF
jgi:hypothetical protein